MRRGLTAYGDEEFSLFLRKAFIKAMGYTDDALERPIIGITNTYSGFNACHRTVPELIEAVKRGVMLAGGLPVEFPTITLHESFAYPTSMYLRNLMAIDTEEMIRAQPVDAVVLIGGCDKTVPALLMGAASANVPAIMLVTGPMLTGNHQGERLGACTDCRRFWARFRAGEIDQQEINEVNAKLAPTAGTCMVMGTASTMALCTEAMGMMLPGGAAIPAVMADRMRNAEATGARAVAIAKEGLTPAKVMTPGVRERIARAARDRRLDQRDRASGRDGGPARHRNRSRRVRPHGPRDAGAGRSEADRPALHGRPVPRRRPDDDIARDQAAAQSRCADDHGRTLGAEIDAAPATIKQDVVRRSRTRFSGRGGMAVLRGNLAPGGAIVKQSAATAKLMQHEGRAVVFDTLEDLAARIDAPDLDVTPRRCSRIARNAGPKGAPGMPEAGYIPIPKKLAQQGVKDMVRISDARMSGTAFGSIVLHITPESAVGGPLALVKNGDRIKLDVARRRLELLVSDANSRRRKWRAPKARAGDERGYRKLFLDTVQQADRGCDFEFLAPAPTTRTPSERQ